MIRVQCGDIIESPEPLAKVISPSLIPSSYPSPKGRRYTFHPLPAGEGGQRPGEGRGSGDIFTEFYSEMPDGNLVKGYLGKRRGLLP
jgi:hypothetical protein